MQPFSEALEPSNRASVDFLLVDIDMALTFLKVASTTASAETAARNRDHAMTAYLTILRYAEKARFSGEDETVFTERFARLKDRLAEAGYPI